MGRAYNDMLSMYRSASQSMTDTRSFPATPERGHSPCFLCMQGAAAVDGTSKDCNRRTPGVKAFADDQLIASQDRNVLRLQDLS